MSLLQLSIHGNGEFLSREIPFLFLLFEPRVDQETRLACPLRLSILLVRLGKRHRFLDQPKSFRALGGQPSLHLEQSGTSSV